MYFKKDLRREVQRYVLNFTGEPFHTYAYDGEFIELPPQPKLEPPAPNDGQMWVYVVTEETYRRLKASGRITTDLARADHDSLGPNHTPMKQIWSYDEDERVLPLNNHISFASTTGTIVNETA